MNKREWGKRRNRGVIFSVIVLILVVIYVTAEQVALMQQKNEIRLVADKLEQLAVDCLEIPLEKADQVANNNATSAAALEALRQELKPYFVKKADYLNEAAALYLSLIQSNVTGEVELTKMEKASGSPRITVEEDTASVMWTRTYRAQGSVLSYAESEPAVQTGTIKVTLDMRLSFVQEKGEWKLYRIIDMYEYNEY